MHSGKDKTKEDVSSLGEAGLGQFCLFPSTPKPSVLSITSVYVLFRDVDFAENQTLSSTGVVKGKDLNITLPSQRITQAIFCHDRKHANKLVSVNRWPQQRLDGMHPGIINAWPWACFVPQWTFAWKVLCDLTCRDRSFPFSQGTLFPQVSSQLHSWLTQVTTHRSYGRTYQNGHLPVTLSTTLLYFPFYLSDMLQIELFFFITCFPSLGGRVYKAGTLTLYPTESPGHIICNQLIFIGWIFKD